MTNETQREPLTTPEREALYRLRCEGAVSCNGFDWKLLHMPMLALYGYAYLDGEKGQWIPKSGPVPIEDQWEGAK